jgi:hypothetical protein
MAGTIIVERKSRRQGHSKITQRPIQQNLCSLTKRLQILRVDGAKSLNASIEERGAEKVRKALGDLAILL